MLSVIAPGPMQKPMVPRGSRMIKPTRTLVHTTMQTVQTKKYTLCRLSLSKFVFLSVAMSLAWRKLIRFEADDGRILRGEPISQNNASVDLGLVTAEDKIQAKVLIGEDIYDTTGITHLTDETVTVAKVLGPLTAAEVPVLRCVGLNYAKHSW